MEPNIKSQPQLTAATQPEETISFDQVYARHWKPLYRTAFRLLHDEQAAEDIIQDTFVCLWENWDTMTHTNIKGWLFTTSYRLVLKRLKQIRSSEPIEQATFCTPLASEADGPLRVRQLQLMVDTCVGKLPEKCRQVYTMSRHDHLSIKHIALELGISPKTVEGHVTAALKRIRQSISTVTILLSILFL